MSKLSGRQFLYLKVSPSDLPASPEKVGGVLRTHAARLATLLRSQVCSPHVVGVSFCLMEDTFQGTPPDTLNDPNKQELSTPC